MEDINAKIKILSVEIAHMVLRAGGQMSFFEICMALSCADSKKVSAVVHLAIERAIASKKIIRYGPETVGVPGDNPKKKRVRASGKLHRLHARRAIIREVVLQILEIDGGDVACREIYARIPDRQKPKTLNAFYSNLHKMDLDDVIVRVSQGRYCHPSHRADVFAAIASAKSPSRKLQMCRRRTCIVEVLNQQNGPIWIRDLSHAIEERGCGTGFYSLQKDLASLRKNHLIIRVRRGWYCATPTSQKSKPTP